MRKLILALCVLTLAACGRDVPQTDQALVSPDLKTLDVQADFRQWVESGQVRTTGSVPHAPITPITPIAPSLTAAAVDGEDTITPASLHLTIPAGECRPVTKTLDLTGTSIRKADIVFAMDLTGSMVGELTTLQAEIQNIIDQLSLIIDDPAFGVISYMDYPGSYEYCGYASTYGDGAMGDLPYILNQPVDIDANLSKTAIAGLALGYGVDGPESYARVMFETYSDPNIAWRAGARRIVVNFGDNVPHDCDLGSCLSLALGSTGVDPGRDGVAGTADDIAIMDAVAGMNAANIALIQVFSETDPTGFDLWSCWAAGTAGGTAVQINPDGTIPGGISLADLVYERVQAVAQRCREVTLVASPGFESWVQNLTPPQYLDVELPASLVFTLDLCVPEGTEPGEYVFEICALCDGGIRVCEQDTVIVPEPEVAFFTGGGTLRNEALKYTFGFNAGPRQVGGPLKGELEFNDHANKRKVHGTTVDFFQVDEDCATWRGDCKVDNVPGYRFEARACDLGEPGKDLDRFGLRVWDSGGDLVLAVGGVIDTGNIQKHVVMAMIGG